MNNIPFYVAGWTVSGIDGALIWFIKTTHSTHPLAYIAAAAFTYMALHLAVYSAIKK
jgi:Na+-transporting methylmalonyl-CoA/oxaloacetate decarboxylase beta subunit